MARQETDREDLFAELLSYSPRWELQFPDGPEIVVAGLREDGRLALFFGPDPVYHFDGENRLLRSFFNGELFRTQGDTLARLKRERTESKTELLRHDLNRIELQQFLSFLHTKLVGFQSRLDRHQMSILRSEPIEISSYAPLLERVQQIVSQEILLAPAYSTRKR